MTLARCALSAASEPDASTGTLRSALLALGERIQQAGSLTEALSAVVGVGRALTGSQQCTLRLFDPSGKALLLVARDGPAMHRGGGGNFGARGGMLGWVAEHRTPLRTNDPASDPRFEVRASQQWVPTGLMVVPLCIRDRCSGTLSVARDDGRAFGVADLERLRVIADLVAPRVEMMRLEQLTVVDPLTQLFNRRHLEARLTAVVTATERTGGACAVAMFDLDYFTRVNTQYGHEVGDEVLVAVAERLRAGCRASDVVCRWGGEEFVMLLPDTNRAQAFFVADRIRKSLSATPVPTRAGPLHVTTSFGVSATGRGKELINLLTRADDALYRAKNAGRNRGERG